MAPERKFKNKNKKEVRRNFKGFKLGQILLS